MKNLENLKALAEKLPEEFKNNALDLIERMGSVIEGIGDEGIAWRPPMLRLVQGTTDRSSIPRGTAIGDFVLGEDKVERPMKFIPLFMHTGRQYWSPDQNENKILCSSPDGKMGRLGECKDCVHGKWDEEAKKSDCGRVKHALAITVDLKDIFAVNFAKTNYASGMDFESLMKKAGVSSYRRVYELDSQTNSKVKNVENYSVKPAAEKAAPAELLEFLSELFKVVQAERKESLEAFYTYVRERLASQPQLAAPAKADAVLLGDSSSQEAASVSEMAKSYVV